MALNRVLIAEDYREWRRQIRSLLQGRHEIEIVCEVADGAEAVEKAAELAPDLILMDLCLPALNGIEASRRIRQTDPRSKILFLSQEKSSDVVQAALDTGALGYVNKTDAARELARAIDAVLQGQRFISRSVDIVSTDARRPRDHEILFCFDDEAILDGLSSFVASALGAGEPAIVVITDSHRKNLVERLQQRGLDMRTFIERGIFTSLDAETPCSSAQFLQMVEGAAQSAFKAVGKHRQIAFCGERAGRLWGQGRTEEAMELERLCAEFVASQNARILCIYPSPHLHDPLGLQTICEQHTGSRHF